MNRVLVSIGISTVFLLAVQIRTAAQEERFSYYSPQVFQGKVEMTNTVPGVPSRGKAGAREADRGGNPRRGGVLRSVANGLVRAVHHAGVASAAAAVCVLEGASGAADTDFYAGFVPYSPYGSSSCVHGYTTAECPYGSLGSSYGSMYLSGRSDVRLRSDYMGGYRFYNTDGSYGTARPGYNGAYRVTTNRGASYYSVSPSAPSYGYSRSSFSSPSYSSPTSSLARYNCW